MTKTVTVDGPAGSGKSSIARALAEKINFKYIESGALYRAATVYFLKHEIAAEDLEKVKEGLQNLSLSIEEGKIISNAEAIPPSELNSPEIEKSVALYARIPEVRSLVKKVQLEESLKQDSVVEGRDIGSKVFSDAFCKFYLDAHIDARVKRRFNEVSKKDSSVSEETVRSEMVERDRLDSTRSVSPMRIPKDAYVIDTTKMSAEEVLQTMERYFLKKKQLTEVSFGDMLTPENSQSGQAKTFEQAIDAYDKNNLEQGKIFSGKIISIDKEIFIDLGGKMDAYIPDRETDRLKRQNLKVGDEIAVVSVAKSSRGTIVSKMRADIEEHRKKVEESFNNKEPVHGLVKRYIEGKGFQISLHGVRAFCPEEEYDIRGFNPHKQKGRKGLFQIEEFSPKQIILSRKNLLQKQQEENKRSFYSTVRPEDVIEVRAVSIKNHGVIVEAMPGVISLLRNKEISWTRFEKTADMVKQGEKFLVKITSVDYESFRMEVSKKQTEEDPFNTFIEKVKRNDILKGKVVQLEKFGAFVEIFPGVDGLLHISDLSWKRNIDHPSEAVKKGDEIEVLILHIDAHERRVRLGYKQLMSNPWDNVEKEYSVNTIVNALVTHVTESVAYCLVNQTIEGEVYFKNSPYRHEKNFDFTKVLKVGDPMRARVMQINRKTRKLELEMKKTFDDPWQDISENYGVNAVIEGKVVEIVEKGVNVRINEHIVGFCHTSQLAIEAPKTAEDAVKIDETYRFCIQFLDVEKKKITLSRKNYLESLSKTSVREYSKKEDQAGTISFAQFMKDE